MSFFSVREDRLLSLRTYFKEYFCDTAYVPKQTTANVINVKCNFWQWQRNRIA